MRLEKYTPDPIYQKYQAGKQRRKGGDRSDLPFNQESGFYPGTPCRLGSIR